MPVIEAHVLLPEDLKARMPKTYSTEKVKTENKILQVKYFTPDANWTWYGVEYDPEYNEMFGFVQGLEDEWGYFSLDELTQVRGALGLKVERDLHFTPIKFSELRPR